MHDREIVRIVDSRLRDVPIPDTLANKLHAITELGDAEIDWQLREVAIPKGLTHRLRQIVPDEQLDERLRDIPTSLVAIARSRVIPARRKRSRLARLALAASLLITVSLGYLGSLGGMLLSFRPAGRDGATMLIVDHGPLDIVSPSDDAVAIIPGPPVGDALAWKAVRQPANEEFPVMLTADQLTLGPAGALSAEMNTVWDPADNWMRLRWPVLGYPQPEVDSLPNLEIVGMPSSPGVGVPMTRDFDRDFIFSRGTQPPVLLRPGSDARRLALPLSTDTQSVARMRESVGQGRSPLPEEIRVEDFLAAMDFDFSPAKPGELAIRTAAGPSIFNPDAAGLLQIGLTAGVPAAKKHSATHLTVALDLSASMAWDHRLEFAKEGVLRALSQLGPDDRFSLIVFREESFLIISQAHSADLDQLQPSIRHLKPRGGADLGAAIQQAITTALETDGTAAMASRLVLITDSRQSLSSDAIDNIQRMLREAAENSFLFNILDLGDAQAKQGGFAAMAEAGNGLVRSPQSANDIRWALVEQLMDGSSLIAEDAELEVVLNPEAVAAYRIVGHEPRSLTQLSAENHRVDLHAGQEVSTLLEVWLHPNAVDDVATLRCKWRNPANGQIREAPPQRISRLQFATSFEGSPVRLQQAAIVAEAVEVLRRSFNFEIVGSGGYRFEPKPRDLQGVSSLVQRANSRLQSNSEFLDLLGVLNEASGKADERDATLVKSGVRMNQSGRWHDARGR